ncbi:Pvc16 family protein [Pseudomonas khavaziana]|uniref:Pvc16 family protein n=1 Tax=Pseudomonas khavaziana TaxID=2842351 RepID=UPI001C3C92FB|nr:Pvc16 family protein [Pseudomonas khavaziana]MBV4482657.1 DUF4255 domain-containing protein [Pseudomonas khavaziana]
MGLQESDDRILRLNEQIYEVLRKYVNVNSEYIRFDMPNKDQPPEAPTLCVFLYDVQEDMKLRQSQPSMTRSTIRQYTPVRCCYLLTYWDPTAQASGPRSQTMIVMNQVLNALLNLELIFNQDSEEGPVLTRVIEPTEKLSSLGTFWHSLGDKPRLCLNLTVTVPVGLALGKPNAPAISHLSLLTEAEGQDRLSDDVLLHELKAVLLKHLAPTTSLVRAQIHNLNMNFQFEKRESDIGKDQLNVSLVGTVAPSVHKKMNAQQLAQLFDMSLNNVTTTFDISELKQTTKEVGEGM